VAADNQGALSTEELTAILREVRDRARARYPQSSGGGPPDPPLPDLLPLVHARDAAEGKVASIGSVNPRRGGPVNAAIQLVKKTAARLLDWHVRDQVEFNRKIVSCIDASIEALNSANRAFVELAGEIRELHRLGDEANQLKDIRTHWSEWRLEWERKLSQNEMQFLRGLADMQAAYQHRSTLMESNFRDIAKSQHQAFETVLDKSVIEIQQRLWQDMEKVRGEYERLIHTELRLVRQRAIAAPAAAVAPLIADQAPPRLQFDYARFAERFRGSEDSTCRSSRAAPTCWTSAADAASSWS
jgi:O-antigen chain-terminating methyltransferase